MAFHTLEKLQMMTTPMTPTIMQLAAWEKRKDGRSTWEGKNLWYNSSTKVLSCPWPKVEQHPSCHDPWSLIFSCSYPLSEVEQERSCCNSQSLHLTELGQDVADRQWGQKQLPYAYLPMCFVGTTSFFKLAPEILLWCLPLLPSNNLYAECFSFTVKSQRLVCSGPCMPPHR